MQLKELPLPALPLALGLHSFNSSVLGLTVNYALAGKKTTVTNQLE
jgi:hypothetical protein